MTLGKFSWARSSTSEQLDDFVTPHFLGPALGLDLSWRLDGGSSGAIGGAFVETANSYPASPDKLAKFCGCLGDLAAAGGIPFAQKEVMEYFGKIAQDGYPAIHHSEAFRKAYQPAYRVVAIDLLQTA